MPLSTMTAMWGTDLPSSSQGQVSVAVPDIFSLVSINTLRFVSNRAYIKSVLMAVQTFRTTGTGGQTDLILARLDTKVSVF